MPLPTIVIAQNDPTVAMQLSNDLHAHFARVAVANNAAELRTMLLRHDARVAVLDLESLTLEDVRQLAHNFDDLTIVCTHRSPDERMWMATMDAGAIEFCHPLDIHTILRASRMAPRQHFQIAA
jgi:DNA-binding NtrC family response regulator